MAVNGWIVNVFVGIFERFVHLPYLFKIVLTRKMIYWYSFNLGINPVDALLILNKLLKTLYANASLFTINTVNFMCILKPYIRISQQFSWKGGLNNHYSLPCISTRMLPKGNRNICIKIWKLNPISITGEHRTPTFSNWCLFNSQSTQKKENIIIFILCVITDGIVQRRSNSMGSVRCCIIMCILFKAAHADS